MDETIAIGVKAVGMATGCRRRRRHAIGRRVHAYAEALDLALDDGEGSAISGPVITEPPDSDAEAVELLHHVVWLARRPSFAEPKRERDHLPDLESIRRWRESS